MGLADRFEEYPKLRELIRLKVSSLVDLVCMEALLSARIESCLFSMKSIFLMFLL